MKNLPIVFMFSGQGSQYFQMARQLYEQQPQFKALLDQCDAIIKPRLARSLVDIIYGDQGKDRPFDRVLHSNPALMAVQISQAQMLMEAGLQPAAVLGYSLGEFVAAVVSGAMDLDEGLHLIVDYAELLEAHPETTGAMLAVLADLTVMREYPQAFSGCTLAGENFSGNFVVAGGSDHIDRLQGFLNERQILNQRLPVRHGFHTELIDGVAKRFREVSLGVRMGAPQIPMLSSCLAGPVDQISIDFLWRVTRQRIDFAPTVLGLCEQGDYHFIDLGPSGTLATFVKYLLPKNSASAHSATINPFGRDLHYINKFKEWGLLPASF